MCRSVTTQPLFWLVEHGVKVFYEWPGMDGDVLIEEYMPPAVPPNE
jgi:hypothetical protein